MSKEEPCRHPNHDEFGVMNGRKIRVCLRCGGLFDERILERGTEEYDADAREAAQFED